MTYRHTEPDKLEKRIRHCCGALLGIACGGLLGLYVAVRWKLGSDARWILIGVLAGLLAGLCGILAERDGDSFWWSLLERVRDSRWWPF